MYSMWYQVGNWETWISVSPNNLNLPLKGRKRPHWSCYKTERSTHTVSEDWRTTEQNLLWFNSNQVYFISFYKWGVLNDDQCLGWKPLVCVPAGRVLCVSGDTSTGVCTLTSYTTTGSIKNCEILSGAPGRTIKRQRQRRQENIFRSCFQISGGDVSPMVNIQFLSNSILCR